MPPRWKISVEHGLVIGLDLGVVFVGFAAVVVLGRVEHRDDEALGFKLRR
jgi:hypothetical protein